MARLCPCGYTFPQHSQDYICPQCGRDSHHRANLVHTPPVQSLRAKRKWQAFRLGNEARDKSIAELKTIGFTLAAIAKRHGMSTSAVHRVLTNSPDYHIGKQKAKRMMRYIDEGMAILDAAAKVGLSHKAARRWYAKAQAQAQDDATPADSDADLGPAQRPPRA